MTQAVLLEVPDLTPVEIAFPANALDWMPKWDEIPAEFRNMNAHTEWNEIVRQWFFSGLPDTVEFHPRKGVDPQKAYDVLWATLTSYGAKHEHKEAACAYMLSCWFKKVTNWKKPK